MEFAINTHVTAPEVAEESVWFKSTYSNDQGGSCVEIAALTSQVGIRDSKNSSGPTLVVPVAAWGSFLGFVLSQSARLDAASC